MQNSAICIDKSCKRPYHLFVSGIHDVAKRAGVSTATVSRTFGAPDKISAETRHRVLEAAQALDYRPRGSGTDAGGVPRLRNAVRPIQRAHTATNTIGFQFFAASNDALAFNTFYAPVLSGVQSEAIAAGLHLMVHTTDRHTSTQELPRMVEERAIAGLLLVGAANAEVLRAFSVYVPQIVVVDAQDPNDAHDAILSDGFGGMYATVRHLIELGHRRIALLNPEEEVGTFRDRQRGYLCALTEAGLPIDPALCLTATGGQFGKGREQNEQGKEDCQSFLNGYFAAYRNREERERPTALVVVNDFYALSVLQVCQSLGIRVPEDISVTGFDDGESAAHCNPPLTTVQVDKEAMGRLAVRRLQARIEEAATGAATLPVARYELPVRLIIRASTGGVGKLPAS